LGKDLQLLSSYAQDDPLGHGGLDLKSPQETAKIEYDYSILITAKLTNQIYYQTLDLEYNPSDQQYTRNMKSRMHKRKMQNQEIVANELFAELTPKSQQVIKGKIEKGGHFLGCQPLPIKAIGYALKPVTNCV